MKTRSSPYLEYKQWLKTARLPEHIIKQSISNYLQPISEEIWPVGAWLYLKACLWPAAQVWPQALKECLPKNPRLSVPTVTSCTVVSLKENLCRSRNQTPQHRRVVQPHLHLAVAWWKPLQRWAAGPCANLFFVSYFLTHKAHISPTEDLHQTDDTAGIPQYFLHSLPSVFLFSRWKHVRYEQTTNAVHMAGCAFDGSGYLPKGRNAQEAAQLWGCRLELQCFFEAK